MSLEETDTSSNFEKTPIPDGDHEFTVICVDPVEKVKGLYEWQLTADDGNDYQQNLFANEMGGLLRVLGCNETSKNKFSWDTVLVEKRKFLATVSHVPDKKNPDIIRQKMTNFRSSPNDSGVPY